VSDERTPIQYAFDWMEQQAERGRERPSQIRLEIAARQQTAANAIRDMQAQLAAVTAERDRYKTALRVIAVREDNILPSRPDIAARARKALRWEVEP
jgi:esterase/lipase